MRTMRFIVSAPPKRIFSFQIPAQAEQQLGDICEAYAAVQLERGFGTLDYWKTIKATV